MDSLLLPCVLYKEGSQALILTTRRYALVTQVVPYIHGALLTRLYGVWYTLILCVVIIDIALDIFVYGAVSQ